MTKYPAVIPGKDFNRLSADEVRALKKIVRIPQHGIRYHPNFPNTVFLTTNCIKDMDDAWTRNHCRWAHSQTPKRVQAGWTVFVLPNSELCSKAPVIFGLRFTATGAATLEAADELKWTSETIGAVFDRAVVLDGAGRFAALGAAL